MPAQDELYKKQLIKRYLSGEATEQELMAFFELIDSQQLHVLINESMDQDIIAIQGENHINHRKSLFWRYMVAACILTFIGVGAYFVLKNQPAQVQVSKIMRYDAAPGRNRATLTLANGQKIILTRGLKGKLAQQGSMAIQVTTGNNVSYLRNKTTNDAIVSYNTLSTSRGEQSPYPLILSDGSKVWLNAASSITFPTSFTGKERKVTVTGEAYIVVAHNASKPFKLVAKDQTINDIGTEFNVNAYDDEPQVITTLIQGNIRVNKGESSMLVKPGEQAITYPDDHGITVKEADMDAVMAWKNGLFHFKHAPLPTVMRQLARWYDVEVVYEGAIPKTDISGEVYRNMNASKVFEVLNNLKINFRIEGNKIIVSDKIQ